MSQKRQPRRQYLRWTKGRHRLLRSRCLGRCLCNPPIHHRRRQITIRRQRLMLGWPHWWTHRHPPRPNDRSDCRQRQLCRLCLARQSRGQRLPVYRLRQHLCCFQTFRQSAHRHHRHHRLPRRCSARPCRRRRRIRSRAIRKWCYHLRRHRHPIHLPLHPSQRHRPRQW